MLLLLWWLLLWWLRRLDYLGQLLAQLVDHFQPAVGTDVQDVLALVLIDDRGVGQLLLESIWRGGEWGGGGSGEGTEGGEIGRSPDHDHQSAAPLNI